ncbi:hypothetical protein GCM10011521_04140 [Arenimonas soli]|uniref:KfrA N-terminal DNA-binding domain-containing protein n=1 Tax=Arenimonas soli TaxID=2269504 RepID=A0ABQ1HCR7_9GAMM|nr:hypothetical protein [Arenimonas soli]GGA69097.1 hypothetical protein GCM10011521_04140 [Arenimonas soli]
MSVVEMLKKVTGRSRSGVAEAEKALAEIHAEISAAKAEVSAASLDFGRRLLEAIANGSPEVVEADLVAKEKRLSRLERAKAEVESRIQAAQAATEAADLAQQWQAAEKALNARREALVQLEAASKVFGAALLAAEQAAREAWQALPVKEVPVGNVGSHRIPPQFTSLGGEIPRLLALATDGRVGGFVGSMLWTLRREVGLVERADQQAKDWLALRGEPPTPPEAA